MSDRSEPIDGEPDIEIGNHFQLRILMRRIPIYPDADIGKMQPFFQYRARHKQSECWTPWLDVTIDVEGEPEAGSY